VSFDAIADPDERLYFMNLPTSFTLPQETIDRLRRIAGELLAASPAFQELLRWPES
jgi:NTE family protein